MMRLIDADKLIVSLNNCALQEAPFLEGEDSDTYDAIQECIKCVENQPTSYDADIALRKLSALKMRYYLTLANTGDVELDYVYQKIANAIDEAIEIVKGGGVDE